MVSRFDYVKYDDESIVKQARLKACAKRVEACMLALDDAHTDFENAIGQELNNSAGGDAGEKADEELRQACLSADCLVRLEQAYMWCGKGIRDQQIERNGTAELQEERKES